jgi:uncharacterized membrane protein
VVERGAADSGLEPADRERRRRVLDAGQEAGDTSLAAVRRSVAEFLGLPTLVLLGFVALGLLMLAVDEARPAPLEPLRAFISQHIFGDPQSTSQLLSSVATTIVTVTSITFSVLLIALQQSASTMSSQVYDQFLRRGRNQGFFGFFLGIGLYALVMLGTVHPGFIPTFGALTTLVLAGVALALIPIVIYATIDEMRPAAIVASIRRHGLDAWKAEDRVVSRTRRQAQTSGPSVEIRSERTGFVTGFDLDGLAEAMTKAGADAEAELVPAVGTFVVYGDVLLRLRGLDTPPDEPLQIERIVDIGRKRNIASDPTYAIEQLEAIGWTSASSAKQNPRPAMLAVGYIRDLATRWVVAEDVTDRDDALPIVYHDRRCEQALAALESLGVAASEGMQPQTAATVFRAFARLLPRLPADLRPTAERSVLRATTALADQVLTVDLEAALAEVAGALEEAGSPEAMRSIRAATQRMAQSAGRLSARGVRPEAV